MSPCSSYAGNPVSVCGDGIADFCSLAHLICPIRRAGNGYPVASGSLSRYAFGADVMGYPCLRWLSTRVPRDVDESEPPGGSRSCRIDGRPWQRGSH